MTIKIKNIKACKFEYYNYQERANSNVKSLVNFLNMLTFWSQAFLLIHLSLKFSLLSDAT